MPQLRYAFLGCTKYSEYLLNSLINHSFKPEVIFTIPEEFSISYSGSKVKNSNFANLKTIATEYGISCYEVESKGQPLSQYSELISSLNLDLLLERSIA